MRPREGALEYEMKRLHSYGVLVNDVELLCALPLLWVVCLPSPVVRGTSKNKSLIRVDPSDRLRRVWCARLRDLQSPARRVEVVDRPGVNHTTPGVGVRCAVYLRYIDFRLF